MASYSNDVSFAQIGRLVSAFEAAGFPSGFVTRPVTFYKAGGGRAHLYHFYADCFPTAAPAGTVPFNEIPKTFACTKCGDRLARGVGDDAGLAGARPLSVDQLTRVLDTLVRTRCGIVSVSQCVRARDGLAAVGALRVQDPAVEPEWLDELRFAARAAAAELDPLIGRHDVGFGHMLAGLLLDAATTSAMVEAALAGVYTDRLPVSGEPYVLAAAIRQHIVDSAGAGQNMAGFIADGWTRQPERFVTCADATSPEYNRRFAGVVLEQLADTHTAGSVNDRLVAAGEQISFELASSVAAAVEQFADSAAAEYANFDGDWTVHRVTSFSELTLEEAFAKFWPLAEICAESGAGWLIATPSTLPASRMADAVRIAASSCVGPRPAQKRMARIARTIRETHAGSSAGLSPELLDAAVLITA